MPWHRRSEWDHATLATYSALTAVRREQPALREGGLRWVHVDDDTLCYLRDHEAGSVLVTARRAGGPAVELPWDDATLLLSTEQYARRRPGRPAAAPC